MDKAAICSGPGEQPLLSFRFFRAFGELLWSQGLGGVRHVFSAAPSKGEGSVTTREATAPEYDYNCLDPQRPGSLQIDSLEC